MVQHEVITGEVQEQQHFTTMVFQAQEEHKEHGSSWFSVPKEEDKRQVPKEGDSRQLGLPREEDAHTHHFQLPKEGKLDLRLHLRFWILDSA